MQTYGYRDWWGCMARSLFDKYGGFASVSKVVMTFYTKVLDSDVIGDYFDGIDMRRLIDHQTKFIATIMGGPVGKSLRTDGNSLERRYARAHQ